MKRLIFTFLIIVALTAASSFAGDHYSYKKEFGGTFGFSPDSRHGIGVTPDQQYYETSLNFGYVFWQNDNYAWKYKISLIPFALVHGGEKTLRLRHNRTVYAGGAEPVGLQLNFRNQRRLQPFVNATGGFLYFTEQTPVTDSSQYNFTFSFGGGVEIFHGRRSLALGYRYHHISNANTATYNPGIDSHMLSIGFSFKR
ncbi:MAG: acyloxyacyl hydrolase [Acidobacteriota bacterium]|jgi:opacity protein-like surface antigen|nr:acyloxyacyl hydrolase [Acidobacteriota bacterium]